MTQIDQYLLKLVVNTVHSAIANSKNREDLWKLSDEIALEITAMIQTDIVGKRKSIDLAEKLHIAPMELTNDDIKNITKISSPVACTKDSEPDLISNPDDMVKKLHIQKSPVDTVAKNANCAKNAHDDSEIPNSHNEDDPVGPIWLSQTINWSEYWVYDYSNPVTTLNGKCGRKCAQTEIWLVHRRKYKLSLVDAEFASVATMHEFLGPLKELAKENKIQPLEVIDEELAGKDEKQRNACRIAKQQSKFGLFLECYDLFHGDPVKISEKMGITKQSVYAYKNKAKTMGVLK